MPGGRLTEVKERQTAQSVDVVNRKPEEVAALIKREIAQRGEVIRAAGIKPQ